MRIDGSFVIGERLIRCEDATPEKVDLLLGSVDGQANAPLPPPPPKNLGHAIPAGGVFEYRRREGAVKTLEWRNAWPDSYAEPPRPPPSAPPRYVLKVEAGTYEAETLPALLWQLLKHRFRHFSRGEGWRD